MAKFFERSKFINDTSTGSSIRFILTIQPHSANVQIGEVFYNKVDKDTIRSIIEKHFDQLKPSDIDHLFVYINKPLLGSKDQLILTDVLENGVWRSPMKTYSNNPSESEIKNASIRLSMGQTQEEAIEDLMEDGMTYEDAYLAVKAGAVLNKQYSQNPTPTFWLTLAGLAGLGFIGYSIWKPKTAQAGTPTVQPATQNIQPATQNKFAYYAAAADTVWPQTEMANQMPSTVSSIIPANPTPPNVALAAPLAGNNAFNHEPVVTFPALGWTVSQSDAIAIYVDGKLSNVVAASTFVPSQNKPSVLCPMTMIVAVPTLVQTTKITHLQLA